MIKKVATASLLLFVVASVLAIAVKGRATTDGPVPAEVSADASPIVVEPDMRDGIVVGYYHGDTRCRTCQAIEALAHASITTGFGPDLTEGTLRWTVVNFERPEFASVVEQYGIVAPIVILSARRDGNEIAWTSLGKVWHLVRDEAKFVEYVQAEVGKFKQEVND